MWKSEAGLTLVELTVVMAVMGVFIAALTSILMVAFDVHAEIVQENREEAGAVLLRQHLERMVKSCDRAMSFQLVDNPKATASADDRQALRIRVGERSGPDMYVFYYVDPDNKTMCFEYGEALDGSANNPGMKLGSGVLAARWEIYSGDGSHYVSCTLTLESEAEGGGTTREETVKFALKSEQISDKSP